MRLYIVEKIILDFSLSFFSMDFSFYRLWISDIVDVDIADTRFNEIVVVCDFQCSDLRVSVV